MKKPSKSKLLKVNSVQETCAKCFAVHIVKFEILEITWKKWNKEHQTLSFQFFISRFSILMFFVLFFMWFARFQISICEPQSIWRKLLVLSWLYFVLLCVSATSLADTNSHARRISQRSFSNPCHLTSLSSKVIIYKYMLRSELSQSFEPSRCKKQSKHISCLL